MFYLANASSITCIVKCVILISLVIVKVVLLQSHLGVCVILLLSEINCVNVSINLRLATPPWLNYLKIKFKSS